MSFVRFWRSRGEIFELEPIRELSLSGLSRATDAMMSSLADCPEWRYIERLTLHHHSEPRAPNGSVLELLRSPHLTRLVSLEGHAIALTDPQRRAFEALPVLRQLEHLGLPHPQGCDPWLSDGTQRAEGWTRLRSLQASTFTSLLPSIAGLPFFQNLDSLHLSNLDPPLFELLLAHLPPNLRHLWAADNDVSLDPLLERLEERPLRWLVLDDDLSPEPLAALFSASSRCEIHSLSLGRRRLEPFVAALARAPKVAELRKFEAGVNSEGSRLGPLLERLVRLEQLDLLLVVLGTEGARALAAAKLGGLRRLDLGLTGIDEPSLRELLASESGRGLVWLSVSGNGEDGWSSAIADDLLSLPHLSVLDCGDLSEENIGALEAREPPMWLVGDGTPQPPVKSPWQFEMPRVSP